MLFAKQVIAFYFFSPTFRKTKSFYLFKYGKERMGFVSGIKGVKAQVVLRTTARARVPEPEPVRAAHSRIVRFSARFARAHRRLRSLNFFNRLELSSSVTVGLP